MRLALNAYEQAQRLSVTRDPRPREKVHHARGGGYGGAATRCVHGESERREYHEVLDGVQMDLRRPSRPLRLRRGVRLTSLERGGVTISDCGQRVV